MHEDAQVSVQLKYQSPKQFPCNLTAVEGNRYFILGHALLPMIKEIFCNKDVIPLIPSSCTNCSHLS